MQGPISIEHVNYRLQHTLLHCKCITGSFFTLRFPCNKVHRKLKVCENHQIKTTEDKKLSLLKRTSQKAALLPRDFARSIDFTNHITYNMHLTPTTTTLRVIEVPGI